MPQSKYAPGKQADSKSHSSGGNIPGSGTTLPAVSVIGQKESATENAEPLQLAVQESRTATAFKPIQKAPTDVQVQPVQRTAFALPAVSKGTDNKVVQRALSKKPSGAWESGKEADKTKKAQLWSALLKLYSETLPAKKELLEALAVQNPEANATIQEKITSITEVTGGDFILTHSQGVIKNTEWTTLSATADAMLRNTVKIVADTRAIQAEQAKLDAANRTYENVIRVMTDTDRRDELFANIAVDGGKIATLKATLGSLTPGTLVPASLTKVKAETSKLKVIFDKHEKRLDLLPLAVTEKGIEPADEGERQQNLIDLVSMANEDELKKLLPAYGTTKLKTLLAYADPVKLKNYIDAEQDNIDPGLLFEWYTAISKKGKDDMLKGLWGVTEPGETGDVTRLLRIAKDNEFNKLIELVKIAGGRTAFTVSTTAGGSLSAAHHLLVTKKIDKAKLTTMLSTKTDTVPCLMIQPDIEFLENYDAIGLARPLMLLQLQMLANAASLMTTFAAGVKGGTINSEALVNEHLKMENNAKTKSWPLKTIGSFAGDEKIAIEEAVTGIDGGAKPAFTGHGPSPAKWKDTWNNNDGDLPGAAGAGGYEEYYVQKEAGTGPHGTRRILKAVSGSLYYTNDHYTSFYWIR